MKNLVCFFSASGTTKALAKKIAESVNADILEIEPVEKYTSTDLDWNDKNSRSSLEMQDENSRPKIKDIDIAIDNYDKIILGFPVWWDVAPRIIYTFLEQVDLKNKKVYVFVTSGGSSVNGSFNDLKNKYPNINFISGKRFFNNETNQDYQSWIEEN